MERSDIFIGGLLYSEALHRQKEALLCYVLVAAAVCFHLFNIVEQEGILCVGRILQQLASVTSYVQIAPAFWLQATGGAAPSLGTGTDQPLRLQCREPGKKRWEQTVLVFFPWPSRRDQICSHQGCLLS